jgi:hypothetical protein
MTHPDQNPTTQHPGNPTTQHPGAPTTSAAQTEANRANAKHSTGPTSDRGKTRSSQNAMRHGLTGRVVVLPTEDMEAYQKFSKELVDSLEAQTPVERQLAQTIADTQWRLNRARSFEDGMLALGHLESAGDFDAPCPDIHSVITSAKVFRDRSKDFVNLSLYEQRIHRSQKEAFRQLEELQTRRLEKESEKKRIEKEKHQEEMDEAIRLLNLHESKVLPATATARATATATASEASPAWNPAQDGFVYSTAQIDLERRRRNRHEEALRFSAAPQTTPANPAANPLKLHARQAA